MDNKQFDINRILDFIKTTGSDLKTKFVRLFKSEEHSEKISFKDEHGNFDFKNGCNGIKNWCMNHKPATLGVALLLVLIIVIVNVKACGNQLYSASGDIEAFKVNKDHAIEELMSSYYTAYANADSESLSLIASPVSDLEKGYVTLLAGYVEEYRNISCYVKSGLEEGSYFVCTSMEMKFYGIDTAAPGVETFYVRTNEEGNYYIDNVYSTFNLQTQEYDLDASMAERITAFENEADVVALCEKVTEKYASAVANDTGLESLINTTLPGAISNWMSTAIAEQKAAEKAAEEQKAAEEAAAAEAAAAEAEAAAKAEAEADAAQAAAEEEEKKQSASEARAQGYFDEGDVISITSSVNIRKGMSTDADRIGTAYSGDKVTVVMSYAEGWTKVIWGNKTGYIRTDILLAQ